MNIAICTDNNYVVPCLATITSFCETHKKECLMITVLTSAGGVKPENLVKFQRLAEFYRQEITVKEVDDNILAGLQASGRFPLSIYFRFLLPELLKDENRVLYLDCDILVRRNICEFYNTDLTDYACAAIEDQRGDDVTIHNRIYMYSKYFNSGVLLMNLDYWRRYDVAKQLITYLRNYPERCWFPDQDALNVVLEGKVKFMDYRYNLQGEMLSHRCYLLLSATKWQALDEAISNPAIIHFTDINKPWYTECRHPYRDEYRKVSFGQPIIGLVLKRRDNILIRIMTIFGKICVKILKKLGRDFPERQLF